jgi:hypothetical protein
MTGSLLDLMELAMLAQPFVSTMGFLTEQARHQILGSSIEKVGTSALQEEIVKNTWLADLDVRRGKGPLRASVKKLPSAPFFRIVLASHLRSRVYWVQWREEDRLALLEAAEDALYPLGLAISEQEEIKRQLRFDLENKEKKDKKDS